MRHSPPRFLFDLDFADHGALDPRAGHTVPLADHELALELARSEAFERGRAEGRAGVEAEAAGHMAADSSRIAEAAMQLLERADAELDVLRREAAALALATGRGLAAALVAREPLAEIEALVEDCLTPLRGTPHLVLRLRAEDAARIRDRLAAAADRHGFTGRLVVLGEDDIAAGDCRLEWADGGLVRDMARAEADIAAALARRFAAASPENAMPATDEDER